MGEIVHTERDGSVLPVSLVKKKAITDLIGGWCERFPQARSRFIQHRTTIRNLCDARGMDVRGAVHTAWREAVYLLARELGIDLLAELTDEQRMKTFGQLSVASSRMFMLAEDGTPLGAQDMEEIDPVAVAANVAPMTNDQFRAAIVDDPDARDVDELRWLIYAMSKDRLEHLNPAECPTRTAFDVWVAMKMLARTDECKKQIDTAAEYFKARAKEQRKEASLSDGGDDQEALISDVLDKLEDDDEGREQAAA